MCKRLQVVLNDEEFEQLREVAREQGMTVSEWVRQMLRKARGDRPEVDQIRRVAAVHAAARHAFPTADIDEMLKEIGRGYGHR